MNTLISIGGKAPKSFWGVLAVICFAINTDRDFLKWMPPETQEVVFQVCRLGAIVGVFYFGLKTDNEEEKPKAKKKVIPKKKPKL